MSSGWECGMMALWLRLGLKGTFIRYRTCGYLREGEALHVHVPEF